MRKYFSINIYVALCAWIDNFPIGDSKTNPNGLLNCLEVAVAGAMLDSCTDYVAFLKFFIIIIIIIYNIHTIIFQKDISKY